MTDPIADMLTRIRNAQMARKSEVMIPFSRIKLGIAEILKKHGYVFNVVRVEEPFPSLKIDLKYNTDKSPAIKKIKRISKPGRKAYVSKENLPKVLNGLGLAIISTSKGLLTDREAKKIGIGGELICEVY
jgi:small subunit ribosomal protein S8